jgi:hypothetical protein
VSIDGLDSRNERRTGELAMLGEERRERRKERRVSRFFSRERLGEEWPGRWPESAVPVRGREESKEAELGSLAAAASPSKEARGDEEEPVPGIQEAR